MSYCRKYLFHTFHLLASVVFSPHQWVDPSQQPSVQQNFHVWGCQFQLVSPLDLDEALVFLLYLKKYGDYENSINQSFNIIKPVSGRRSTKEQISRWRWLTSLKGRFLQIAAAQMEQCSITLPNRWINSS